MTPIKPLRGEGMKRNYKQDAEIWNALRMKAKDEWELLPDVNGEIPLLKAHHLVCKYYDTILEALAAR